MSEKKPENPQAFPPNAGWRDDDQNARGMTLRDYFAAKALSGLCANSSKELLLTFIKEATERGECRMSGTFAREAYEFADAMLAEREKSQ